MVRIMALRIGRKEIRTYVSKNSISRNRNSRRNYIRQRLQVHLTLLTNNHTSHRNKNETIVSISCTNRWTNRTSKSSSRTIFTSLHRLSTDKLGTVSTHRAIFLQQR